MSNTEVSHLVMGYGGVGKYLDGAKQPPFTLTGACSAQAAHRCMAHSHFAINL